MKFSNEETRAEHINNQTCEVSCFRADCEEKFASRARARRHEKTKHESLKMDGERKCQWCELVFTKRSELTKHVKTAHGKTRVSESLVWARNGGSFIIAANESEGPKTAVCADCDNGVSYPRPTGSTVGLRNHIKKVHPEKWNKITCQN